jgi:hypothetical protein
MAGDEYGLFRFLQFFIMLTVGVCVLGVFVVEITVDPIPHERSTTNAIVFLSLLTPPTSGATIFAVRLFRRSDKRRRARDIAGFLLSSFFAVLIWAVVWFLLIDNCGAGGDCEYFWDWEQGKGLAVSSLAPAGIILITLATTLRPRTTR